MKSNKFLHKSSSNRWFRGLTSFTVSDAYRYFVGQTKCKIFRTILRLQLSLSVVGFGYKIRLMLYTISKCQTISATDSHRFDDETTM